MRSAVAKGSNAPKSHRNVSVILGIGGNRLTVGRKKDLFVSFRKRTPHVPEPYTFQRLIACMHRIPHETQYVYADARIQVTQETLKVSIVSIYAGVSSHVGCWVRRRAV